MKPGSCELFGDRGVSGSNRVPFGVCRLLISRTNLGRHIWNIHKKSKTLDMSTLPNRCFMVDSCMQAQGRKTAASDGTTPASVHSIADFITPVRLKLLIKLPVRKVAEINPHKTLGQPPSPSATKTKKRKKKAKRKYAWVKKRTSFSYSLGVNLKKPSIGYTMFYY